MLRNVSYPNVHCVDRSRINVLQAQQDARNIITGGSIYFDIGNVALTDAHLWRKYFSHREFSNENLKAEALVREVAFAKPFSMKTMIIIISKLLEFSIFYANRLLFNSQWPILSQLIVLY